MHAGQQACRAAQQQWRAGGHERPGGGTGLSGVYFG
jgi:hypothetical protein